MEIENFKAEIVCILNNMIGYEEDDSKELENYWDIADKIVNIDERGLKDNGN